MARCRNTKAEIKLTVNIKPMKLADVTPAQLRRYRAAWARLIAKASREAQAQSQQARDEAAR